MLFFKGNPKSESAKIYRQAPNVSAPFVVGDKNEPSPFYKNDFAMNQIVGGYDKGPESSYAKKLVEKYPLDNE